MTEQIWKATGLTCDHCKQSVSTKLMGIPGMEGVSVDVHSGELSVIRTNGSREFTDDEIGFAMREAGRYILSK